MRIDSIKSLHGVYTQQGIAENNHKRTNSVAEKEYSYNTLPLNYNRHLVTKTGMSHCISFMGYPVHIVDGGNHATNMQHFANAISRDMDISMHMVETNSKHQNTKQLKSLEQELKVLNSSSNLKGVYIAVPALASVPLLNLKDQYMRVMGESKTFTPENLKTNKKKLLEFLRKIYESPSYYREYIGYMDSTKQGIEYTYGVIQEINKLIQKGAKVYIPSGHPHDETIKWLAGERGLKPELYHYIATGVDANGEIQKLSEEVKEKNWYDFNLLTLSDANIVGVKGTKGVQDYMFAAYDSCITDGARGVYNFTPIRRDGQLVGYSYTDTSTNEYPYTEFPANSEVANITKFVGKKISEVEANQREIRLLTDKMNNGLPTTSCSDKLYPISQIFTPAEMGAKKMKLRGDYVDRSLKLFFRKNKDGVVIFPQCDCEGSGKPSVLSMWGSCFAVMNAIARDIRIAESAKNRTALSSAYGNHGSASYEAAISDLIDQAKKDQISGHYRFAEHTYNAAIALVKEYKELGYKKQLYAPYLGLAELHMKTGKLEEASACYNIALNMIAKILKEKPACHVRNSGEMTLSLIKKYAGRHEKINDYFGEKAWYDSLFWLAQAFVTSPLAPSFDDDDNYDKNSYLEFYNLYKNTIPLAANIYDKIGDICRRRGEDYPARVCAAAAQDIRNCTSRGDVVLTKRTEGVHYIGDLYSEIRQH